MKKTIGVVFGWQSAEHDVSCMSAVNICESIDSHEYAIVLLYISKQWERFLAERIADDQEGKKLRRILMPQLWWGIYELGSQVLVTRIDILFPVLHGPNGEDGTIQGLCELINIPYVWCWVSSSSMCMDKEITKRLLIQAEIPVVPFMVVYRKWKHPSFDSIKKKLGVPLFVKPANMWSSIGVAKVENKKQYISALQQAFLYDSKVLIEQWIDGREVECSVLDGYPPIASKIWEIVINWWFYDYETKYHDDNHTNHSIIVPTPLESHIEQRLQDISIIAFKALQCSWLARIDFFVQEDGTIYLNEINTMPGFTKHSMYPKALQASWISQKEIIDRLLSLALKER